MLYILTINTEPSDTETEDFTHTALSKALNGAVQGVLAAYNKENNLYEENAYLEMDTFEELLAYASAQGWDVKLVVTQS